MTVVESSNNLGVATSISKLSDRSIGTCPVPPPTSPHVGTVGGTTTTPAGRVPNPNQPKLRRKAPIADTLQQLSAVQRLVEYFVVVTSEPRWEETNQPTIGSSHSLGTGENGASSERPSSRRNSAFRRRNKPRMPNLRRGMLRPNESFSTTESRQESSDTSSAELDTCSRSTSTTSAQEQQEQGTDGNIHLTDHGKTHHFRPKVTARYPLVDHDDNPFNPMVLQFCHPAGDVIEPSKSYEMPRVHHFVLTNERGRKVYGTCLTIMEEYVPTGGPWCSRSYTTEDDSKDGKIEVSVNRHARKALYIPKVLCLLSTWAYLTAFREYMAQLYRLATATNILTAPIERYIVNICCEVPAPPPGAYEVQVSILDSTIRFWAPPAKLPLAYVALPFQILFECLDLENVLLVWSAMVLERKILLVSSQSSILTVCAEILCSLLFPMRWSHLYVPLLPRMLCPMLDAPVPYLCGVVRDIWLHAQEHVSSDTIVVDLDRNRVGLGEMVPPLPTFPQRKYTKLKTNLTETVGHVFWRTRGLEREYRAMIHKKPHKRNFEKLKQRQGSGWSEKLAGLDHGFTLAYTPDSPNLLRDTLPEEECYMWDRVQEAFLRFFVALFKDYRKHISTPKNADSTKGQKPTFDRVGFLSSQKSERAEFLVELCMTQQFDDFLTRRMYSPGEPDLVFFDQSIDAKLNRSKLKLRKVDTPFLHSAKAHKELKKTQAIEPNGDSLREYDYEAVLKHYVYSKWPDQFKPELFSEPRPIPNMIAAEFDRQTVLVAKLRASFVEDELDEDTILEFYGGDYDTSPEVASFTVFFFVYSALVGRDWQTFQKKRRLLEEANNKSIGNLPIASIERRDAAEQEVETMLPNINISSDRLAMEGMCSDLSMGICDSCPDGSLMALKSAIVLCGDGAQDIYAAMFEKTANQVRLLEEAEEIKINQLNCQDVIIEYEEAREVASAQLDLSFEVLSTMSIRNLSADSDAYLSLMEACGRCGDTQRALNLLELMRHDGFVADSEVLSCFVSAFAHDEAGGIDFGSPVPASSTQPVDNKGTDAYSNYLEKKFTAAKDADKHPLQIPYLNVFMSETNAAEDATVSESSGASASDCQGNKLPSGGAAFLEWFAKHQDYACGHPKKERRRKRRKSQITPVDTLKVTEMVSRQLTLGESLLDYLYPDLSIDTDSDSCPHCSNVLSENDVVAGWSPCAFQDFTTRCPKCEHRFVPRFSVSSTSNDFMGSQGPQTPLYCEFLSPWVVRKELQHIIKGGVGIMGMLEPSWRSGRAIESTLFWNLMVLCRRYRLPFTFLLQGSFKNNRLILPRMPTDM